MYKITVHEPIFYNKNYYPYYLKYDKEFINKIFKRYRTSLNPYNKKNWMMQNKPTHYPIKKRWSKKTQNKFSW